MCWYAIHGESFMFQFVQKFQISFHLSCHYRVASTIKFANKIGLNLIKLTGLTRLRNTNLVRSSVRVAYKSCRRQATISWAHTHVRRRIEPHLSEQRRNKSKINRKHKNTKIVISLARWRGIARITQNYYYACNSHCWKMYQRFRSAQSVQSNTQLQNHTYSISIWYDIIALYTRLSHRARTPSIRGREMALTTTTTLCDKILPQRMCVIEKWTMCYWRLLQALAATTARLWWWNKQFSLDFILLSISFFFFYYCCALWCLLRHVSAGAVCALRKWFIVFSILFLLFHDDDDDCSRPLEFPQCTWDRLEWRIECIRSEYFIVNMYKLPFEHCIKHVQISSGICCLIHSIHIVRCF